MPVPAGLNFVDVHITEMQAGIGTTRLVSISYSNLFLSCTQLKDAWIATLGKSGRAVEPYSPGDGMIFLKHRRMTVGITLSSSETCPDPFVWAQSR